MPFDKYRDANRANWDDRVPIHLASNAYDIETFKKDRYNLSPIVRFDKGLIGDVQDKTLLHLMCHFGHDTLSWAKLGAKVAGIDFSPKAIEVARELSAEIGLSGRFIESDIYDSPTVLVEQFDIVYTGIGVLCWLSDIRGWAGVVSNFVKPGGTFLITEIHPVAWSLDQDRDDRLLSLTDRYFEIEAPLENEEEHSYTDGETILDHSVSYGWNHGLGEIVTALINAGLHIEFLHEYPFVHGWSGMQDMERGDDGMWRLPDGNEKVPLMYSVRATKPVRA